MTLERRLEDARQSLAPRWDEDRAQRVEAGLHRRARAARRVRVLQVSALLVVMVGLGVGLLRPAEVAVPEVVVDATAGLATELPAAQGRTYEISKGTVRFAVKGGTQPVRLLAGPVEVSVTNTRVLVERTSTGSRVVVEEGSAQVRWPGGTAVLRSGEEGVFPPDRVEVLPSAVAPAPSPAPAPGRVEVLPSAVAPPSPAPDRVEVLPSSAVAPDPSPAPDRVEVLPSSAVPRAPSPPPPSSAVAPLAPSSAPRSSAVAPLAPLSAPPSSAVLPPAPPSSAVAPLVPSSAPRSSAVAPPALHAVKKPVPPASSAPLPHAQWTDLARDGDYKGAWDALRTTAPRDETAELLLAADVARLSGHPDAAVAPLQQVLSGHATDARAPLAAFTLGRVLLDDLGRPREAATAFETARTLAPASRLSEDALAREVEAAFRAQDPRARELAQRFIKDFPSSPRLKSVRYFGGLEQ